MEKLSSLLTTNKLQNKKTSNVTLKMKGLKLFIFVLENIVSESDCTLGNVTNESHSFIRLRLTEKSERVRGNEKKLTLSGGN